MNLQIFLFNFNSFHYKCLMYPRIIFEIEEK